MDVDDHSNIIGQVARCKTMYTFKHQNTQKIVSVFTNGLKFQWFNEIYTSSVNIIIVITYNSSTKILDSLHTIEITFSSASQFGLNIWFIDLSSNCLGDILFNLRRTWRFKFSHSCKICSSQLRSSFTSKPRYLVLFTSLNLITFQIYGKLVEI